MADDLNSDVNYIAYKQMLRAEGLTDQFLPAAGALPQAPQGLNQGLEPVLALVGEFDLTLALPQPVINSRLELIRQLQGLPINPLFVPGILTVGDD